MKSNLKLLLKIVIILIIAFGAERTAICSGWIFNNSFSDNTKIEPLNKQLGKNYFEMVEANQEFWKDKTPRPGSGWKQFKRWEYFWNQRINSQGLAPDMNQIYIESQNYIIEKNKNNDKNNKILAEEVWKSKGPSSVPLAQDGTPSGMGRINCIAIDQKDPKVIWVGAAFGGVWKSSTSGATWQNSPMTDFLSLGITDICIAPSSNTFASDTVYASTGDADGSLSSNVCNSVGVIKTTDGGKTWKPTGLVTKLSDNLKVNKLIMSPSDKNKLIASTTSVGNGQEIDAISVTTDGGNTWVIKFSGILARDMVFKPDNPNLLYLALAYNSNGSTYYGVCKYDLSKDSIFILAQRPFSDVERMALAVNPKKPNDIFVVSVNRATQGLLDIIRTTDAGVSWLYEAQATTHGDLLNADYDVKNASGPSQGFYDLALAVSQDNNEDVYLGGVNIWKLRSEEHTSELQSQR